MKIYLQILGTETGDSCPNILIFFDQKRYLFNCGEGTQRFCIEHKIRFAKVDHIFISQLCWEQIGGIPGGLLSLYEMGVKSINIFGPQGLTNFLEALRYFFQRHDMTLTVREFQDDECFQDENLKVLPIVLTSQHENKLNDVSQSQKDQSPASSETIKSSSLEQLSSLKIASTVFYDKQSKLYTLYLTQHRVVKKRKFSETKNVNESTTPSLSESDNMNENSEMNEPHEILSPSNSASSSQPKHKVRPYARLIPRTSNASPSQTVISYICHTPTVPGKFNVQKATQLGVPKGPLFGALRRGETITLDNGTVVKPSDCIEPDTPGAIFIIVHCPSLDYVSSLSSHPTFRPYFKPTSHNNNNNNNNNNTQTFQNHWKFVRCIVHITPLHVLTTSEYVHWMNSFDENVQHIVINKELCKQQLIFRSAAINSVKLNFLHPQIFPKPLSISISNSENFLSKSDFPKKIIAAEPLLKFHLCPILRIGLDKSEIFSDPDEKEILQSVENDEQLKEVIKQQQETLINEAQDNVKKQNSFSLQPKIIFLGTGAAIPSKYRNVSATFIQIPQFGGLLLDVGEGTYGQLVRLFGYNGVNSILMNLKCIFVSHIHADHHLGLIRILTKREEILLTERGREENEELLIVGPTQLLYWLQEFSEIQPLKFRFCDSRDLLNSPDHSFKQFFLEQLGILKWFTVEAIHCLDAFSLIIEHKDGWKLVFSGDTRPNPNLVEAGSGCTLLIHEATFEDDLQDEAINKLHSTTREALLVASQMKANLVILNHFSQRYPKIPTLDVQLEKNVGIAFDFMTICFDSFRTLTTLLPILKCMFREDLIKRLEDDDDSIETSEFPNDPNNKSYQKQKKKKSNVTTKAHTNTK